MTNEYALKIVENMIEVMGKLLDDRYSSKFKDVEGAQDFFKNWKLEFTNHELDAAKLGPFDIYFYPKEFDEQVEDYERSVREDERNRRVELDDIVSREILEDLKISLYNLN